MSSVSERLPALTGHDLYLFREGTHTRLYDKLGAHLVADGTRAATHFSVWAPNAQSVAVVGDFNGWDSRANPMEQGGDSGIWQAAVARRLAGKGEAASLPPIQEIEPDASGRGLVPLLHNIRPSPTTPIQPDDLAAIYFTSGSTAERNASS